MLQICSGGRREELARRSLILPEPGRKSGLHPQLQRARQVTLFLCHSWIITVLCYFVAVVLFFCSLAFLTTQMLKYKESLWIGMNDVNWEMRFVWTDGKGIGFTNWAKGHPVSVPRGRNTYNDEVTSRSPPLFSAGLSAFPPPQRRRQNEAKRIHENDENLFE